MEALLSLDDLIDDELVVVEPPSSSAPACPELVAQPAAQVAAKQRVVLPLLPSEAAARTGGRPALQAVTRHEAGDAHPGGWGQHGAGKAVTAATTKSEPTMEKYSQLRIKSRVLSSIIVDERLRDLRVLRLSQLRGDLSGTWALVGVLVERGATKETSNGRRFCTWTLGDLDGATRKLFLFGDAFAEHGKEIEGSILVVLAPKISRPEDGAGEVAFSVDKGAQLFKLGWAADFGFCKAERKDGKPCTMAVNVRVCEYCSYHAGAALKALEARPNGRMDASGSARAMTERRKLTQVANRAGQGSYLHHHAAGVVGGLRQTQPAKPAAPIGKVNVEELRRLAAETGRANSQGARLVTHLANSAGGGQPSLALPQPRPGTVGAQSRMRMTGSSVPQALHPPKAGGAQRPQQPHVVVMMDNDAFGDDDGLPMDNFAHLPLSQRGTNALDKDPARMQAVALSKQIGGFKRPDPGGPRQRPPLIAAPQQRPLQQTTAWNPPAGRASALSAALPARAAPSLVWAQQVPHASAANNNKRSLSAAFGAVTAGDDAAAGSIHAALAEEDVELNLQRTLDLLAKREGLAEAAEKVTSIKVHAFKCMCGALTERQRPECLDLGHHGRTVHVEKRFWECRHCHRRCLTLDSKHPPLRPCTNCGGINFDATPLGGRRKVDVQDGVACREALLPRGEEHAFSLKSLR